MTLSVQDKYLKGFVSDEDIAAIAPACYDAFDTLMAHSGPGADFLGWLDLPVDYDKEEFARIQVTAKKIQEKCDIFLVLGIGGSYLGARAAIEFVKSPNYNDIPGKQTPNIYYAGNNISTSAINELLAICEGKDLCVNVISKSGTTTETAVAFRVFRDYLIDKYGEDEAKERIFATTDKEKGTLKSYATQCGYETFVVPNNVGGRFSVLTAVGLLPIAVAGIDIEALMQGAQDARVAFQKRSLDDNDALRYAAIRNILYRSGKKTEIVVGYEPYMLMINEWWKQLFGESEGKDGKGLFPSSVCFSTDLHSLGQYIQQGERHLFETIISVDSIGEEFLIPHDDANIDGLNYLAGKPLDYVNKQAMLATLLAHCDGGVPNIIIHLADRTPHTLGYMFYFFEFACSISGYILGVNPFNQPGVESYKKNMFALLGKPGYEKRMEELKSQIDLK